MDDEEVNVALLSGYIAAAVNTRSYGENLYRVVLGRSGFLVVQSVASGNRYTIDIEKMRDEQWEGLQALARLNEDSSTNSP